MLTHLIILQPTTTVFRNVVVLVKLAAKVTSSLRPDSAKGWVERSDGTAARKFANSHSSINFVEILKY